MEVEYLDCYSDRELEMWREERGGRGVVGGELEVEWGVSLY